MSAAKPKYLPKPRYWTDTQVAARLNCSISHFAKKKEKFYLDGMPKPDPLHDNKTDSKALERWCDRRSGLIVSVTGNVEVEGVDRALERVRSHHHGTGHV